MTKKIRVCKNFTYYSIIKEAILAQKGQKATSTQIFNYITNKHPHLFKQSNSMTWKGNIRQLLSKNPEFVKLQKDEISKLHYWRFVPIEEIIENEKEMSYEHNFMQFRNDHANYFNYYQSSHRYPMQNSVYNYYPEYPSYTPQFQEQFFGYKHHFSGFTNHMANRNNTDFYSMGKNCYVDNLFNNNNPQFNDPYLAYNYNTFMPSNRKDYECNKEDIKSKIMAANVLNELRDYQEDFHKNSRKTYRDFNEKPFNCSEAFADIQNNEFLSENKIFKNCEPDNNDPVKNKATVNDNIKNEYQDKSITTHSDQVYESFDKKCTLNNNNDENLQKYKIANLESYENFYSTNKSFKNKMSTEKTLNSNIEYHNKKNVIYDNFLQEKNNCEKDKIDVFIDLRNNTTSGKFKNNNTASLSLSDIVDNLDFANKESLSVIELPDVKVCSEKICSKSEDQAQILIRRRKCTSKPINSKQSTPDKNLSLSREKSKSVALETKTQQNSSKHKTKGSEKFIPHMKIYNLFTKTESKKPVSIFSLDIFENFLIIASTNGDIDLYKDKYTIYKTVRKHAGAVLCVRFNQHGSLIASCGDDGAVIVYDIDLNVINFFKFHSGDVTNVLWTNKYLISVGHDGCIIFYDEKHFNVIAKIKSHENKITGIGGNKKNNFICTQGDDGIVLYKDHSVYKKIPPNEGVILESFFSRMSWSPDGSIFSCGLSFNQKVNSIEIYNLEMESKYSLLGHVAPCEVTCFNPKTFINGVKQYYILAVGSQDLSISLWTTLSPYPFLLIKNVCEMPILDLAWSLDGTNLYYCSYDGTVGKLEFDLKELGNISTVEHTTENSDLFLTLLNAELYDKKIQKLINNRINNTRMIKKNINNLELPQISNQNKIHKEHNDKLYKESFLHEKSEIKAKNKNFKHLNIPSEIKNIQYYINNENNKSDVDFRYKSQNVSMEEKLKKNNNLIKIQDNDRNTKTSFFDESVFSSSDNFNYKKETPPSTYKSNDQYFDSLNPSLRNQHMQNYSEGIRQNFNPFHNNYEMHRRPFIPPPGHFNMDGMPMYPPYMHNNRMMHMQNYDLNMTMKPNFMQHTQRNDIRTLRDHEQSRCDKIPEDKLQKLEPLNTEDVGLRKKDIIEQVENNEKCKTEPELSVNEKSNNLPTKNEQPNLTTKVIKRKVVKPVLLDDKKEAPVEVSMFNYKQSVRIENGVIEEFYKDFGDYSIELNSEKTKLTIKRCKKDFFEIYGKFNFLCASKRYICVYTTNIEIYDLRTGTLVCPFIGAGSVIYMDICDTNLLFLEGDGTVGIFDIKRNSLLNTRVPRYETVVRIRFSKLYFIICEYKDSEYILDKNTKLWYLLRKDWNDLSTTNIDYENTVDETIKKLENKFLINFKNKRHDKLKKITKKMIKILMNIKLTDQYENIIKKFL